MIDGARLVVHGTDDGIEWETLLQVEKVSLVIDGAPTQVFQIQISTDTLNYCATLIV